MKVTFTNAEEFLAELKADRHKVKRGIVRMTYRYSKAEKFPILTREEIMASYEVDTGNGGSQVVELTSNLGYFGPDKKPSEMVEAGNKIYEAIESACEELELELRAGTFQE